ncbi:hypothetical protein SteCoe_33838 [Stentor coeruleus]|uniref:Peroxin-13 n=1 Tax=Stentor coeruleus TaxID=5963 RepID=A0A1R2AW24_9CILI|nr:hypothetical protein SteCoe_33838 [Stentor coeruleus]
MTAPPKPWEVARAQPSLAPTTQSVSSPAINQPSNATTITGASSLGTTGIANSAYRRPMNSPYSLRSGYMGGGGYGMGYGGMGMGMGMYGMGGMGGMGGYGMQGYGAPSKGMIAIERFSLLVNSLCFTAETLENSMNSMKMFWETILRIKSWGAGGIIAVQKMLQNKLNYFIKYFLYLIGKGEKPDDKDGISIKTVFLNIAILYVLFLGAKFCWTEFTKPSEEMIDDMDLF